MTAEQKTRNCALSWGLSPGFKRFSPASVAIDQLLCLPEPLMPAKGFSWSRQIRPYFSAVFFVVAGFDGDAELEELGLGVGHAGQDALGDGAEVLVFQLLALGRRAPE